MTNKVNLDINWTLSEAINPLQNKFNPAAKAVITNLYQEFTAIKTGDGVSSAALKGKVLTEVQVNPLVPELKIIQALFCAALDIKALDLAAADKNLKTIDSPQASFISASITLEKLLKNPEDTSLRQELSKHLNAAYRTLWIPLCETTPRQKLLHNLAEWLKWDRSPVSLAKNLWQLSTFLKIEKENSELLGSLKPTQKILAETFGNPAIFKTLFEDPKTFDHLSLLIKENQINTADPDYTKFFDNLGQALLNGNLPGKLEDKKLFELIRAVDINHTEFNYAKALFQLQPGESNQAALNQLKQLAEANHPASVLFHSKIKTKSNASIASGLQAIEDKKPLVIKKIEEFNKASKEKRNKIILIALLTLFSPVLLPVALAALFIAGFLLLLCLPLMGGNQSNRKGPLCSCTWLR